MSASGLVFLLQPKKQLFIERILLVYGFYKDAGITGQFGEIQLLFSLFALKHQYGLAFVKLLVHEQALDKRSLASIQKAGEQKNRNVHIFHLLAGYTLNSAWSLSSLS